VDLAWVRPTTNSNGTTLTNLAGYRLYYGASPGAYGGTFIPGRPSPIDLPLGSLSDPANPTVTLTGIPFGTHGFFTVTAYSPTAESIFSNEVNKAF
jgi:hypothetical protein